MQHHGVTCWHAHNAFTHERVKHCTVARKRSKLRTRTTSQSFALIEATFSNKNLIDGFRAERTCDIDCPVLKPSSSTRIADRDRQFASFLFFWSIIPKRESRLTPCARCGCTRTIHSTALGGVWLRMCDVGVDQGLQLCTRGELTSRTRGNSKKSFDRSPRIIPWGESQT